ncbi:hypothetical protein Tco_1545961 [Tanacetum coccineum]
MESSDLVDTPMVEKSKLDEDTQGKAIDPTHYHGMVGTLMYLIASRPYLTFAVCMCARYQAKPTEKHLYATLIMRVAKILDEVHQETDLLADHQKGRKALQNKRDLPRDIPLDSVVVLRYEKRSKSKNNGKVPTVMELVLEQTQQGTSYEVLVSAEGVKELKRKVKIKGKKKEALLTLRQKPDAGKKDHSESGAIGWCLRTRDGLQTDDSYKYEHCSEKMRKRKGKSWKPDQDQLWRSWPHLEEKHMTWARFGKKRDENTTEVNSDDITMTYQCMKTALESAATSSEVNSDDITTNCDAVMITDSKEAYRTIEGGGGKVNSECVVKNVLMGCGGAFARNVGNKKTVYALRRLEDDKNEDDVV